MGASDEARNEIKLLTKLAMSTLNRYLIFNKVTINKDDISYYTKKKTNDTKKTGTSFLPFSADADNVLYDFF